MNRRNTNSGPSLEHVNYAFHQKSRFVERLLGAVSGIALLTACVCFSQPAMAASGGDAISSNASDPRGGVGGVDGDPAAAKGKDGVPVVRLAEAVEVPLILQRAKVCLEEIDQRAAQLVTLVQQERRIHRL